MLLSFKVAIESRNETATNSKEGSTMNKIANVFSVWCRARTLSQHSLCKESQEWLKDHGVIVRDDNPLARVVFKTTGSAAIDFRELLKARDERDRDSAKEYTRKLSEYGISVRFVPAQKGIPIRMAKGAFQAKLGRKQQG